jgi:uncharacterized membrane protein YfcA
LAEARRRPGFSLEGSPANGDPFVRGGNMLRRARIVARWLSPHHPAMDLSVSLAVFAFGAYLVAGFVKGAIGLGLPSIAIGLMALVMAPAQAATLLIFPSLVTNIWQALAGPYLPTLLKRFWLLLVGSVIGVWLGGGVLTSENSRIAAFGLGVALVCYGVIGLTGAQFSVRREAERWLGFPIGFTTGLVAGATGVFVLPAGMYFQALGLNKDELVQMLGVSFTVSTVALAAILLRDGVMELSNTTASLLAVMPALLGMVLGQRLRHSASPATFRTLFFSGMLLLGLAQAVRNVPL